jgi:hypothetical protein
LLSPKANVDDQVEIGDIDAHASGRARRPPRGNEDRDLVSATLAMVCVRARPSPA